MAVDFDHYGRLGPGGTREQRQAGRTIQMYGKCSESIAASLWSDKRVVVDDSAQTTETTARKICWSSG
ncbi:hypothetical protein CC2G_002570 [Coprinopsis cinerea AmutBmut pab1-1]|nr:hypothetical protein CC2G_002570 [Coprinopsis cinerea AmutBmut pab1-1]